MASSLIDTSSLMALRNWQQLSSLPKYGSVDDLAAMAVVATLSVLYLFKGVLWNRPDPYLYKMYERPQEHLKSESAAITTRDISKKMEQMGADIVVFWGSQSGTAEKMANRLCKELRQRFRKNALAADMSDFDPATIASIPSKKLAMFIVSTYGEGEPSDNVNEFWSWLGTKSKVSFSELRYVAFGLGNSNYKYYNAVVDYITHRLDSLDAQQVLSTGKANDCQGQTEEHYLEWKTSLFEMLKSKLGFEEHESVYEPATDVQEINETPPTEIYDQTPWTPSNAKSSRAVSPIQNLPIKATRELFKDAKDRNCIHMELDLSEQPGMRYKTGDHMGIWPTNPTAEVETLLRCLGREDDRQTILKITELEEGAKAKVPSCTSLEALLTNYVEVCAPVSREDIGSLVQFAPTNESKELLARLSSDKSAYDNLLHTTYITLGRLLELAAPKAGAWRMIPLSFIIETLPATRPRYYSISSSSVVQPRKVAITAVVADKILSSDEIRVPGLCTNYLLLRQRSLDTSTAPSETTPRLFAHIRKSTFKLPALSSHPLVMVGAGTGIAPFHAFLQERARLCKMGRPMGRAVLIFGCRNENQDFVYREELEELQAVLGSNMNLLTAFSRPDKGRKKYVQDRIQESSEELAGLLVEHDANFYICGSASMARDVSRTIGTILSENQGWEDDEVQRFMERQKKARRWQQDVWG